jgi:hypothetical protein
MRTSKERVKALERRLTTVYRSQSAAGPSSLTPAWRAGLMKELHGRFLFPFPVETGFWSDALEQTVFRFAATTAMAATAAAAYGIVALWGANLELFELAVDYGSLVSLQIFGL